ncbi:MAG: MarR family winged helix-turn-helix transcriptional regulator [Dermatophilaceae bacterium]
MEPPVRDQVMAWTAMLRAHQVIESRLDAAIRERAGITLAEHEVLVVALAAGGRLRMGALASRLVLSKSGITRLVAKLEDGGLLRREIPPDNRRVTLAVLTPRGRQVLRRAVPAFERALREAFGHHLTATDVASLGRVARKLVLAHGCHDPWASEDTDGRTVLEEYARGCGPTDSTDALGGARDAAESGQGGRPRPG